LISVDGQDLGFVDGLGTGLRVYNLGDGELCSEISWKSDSNVPVNSSYVIRHPELSVVYAVDELADKDGHVYSYKLSPEGGLTFLSKVESKGRATCHIAVDSKGEYLFMCSYMGGPVRSVKLDKETGALGDVVCTVESCFRGEFQLPGPNIGRQEMAHPHMCYLHERTNVINFYPDDDDCNATEIKKRVMSLFVPDLGLDCIHMFNVDPSNGMLRNHRAFPMPKGNGPRHLAHHPTDQVMFVLFELTSVVSMIKTDDASLNELDANIDLTSPLKKRRKAPTGNEEKKFLATFSTVDGTSNKSSDASTTASAIVLHPNGKFLYCSNRTAEKKNGSISLFYYNSQGPTLSYVRSFNTLGRTPREMKLNSHGTKLFVANQDSDTIHIFDISEDDGLLSEKPSLTINTPTPVALCLTI